MYSAWVDMHVRPEMCEVSGVNFKLTKGPCGILVQETEPLLLSTG